jgi:hypothetical protein
MQNSFTVNHAINLSKNIQRTAVKIFDKPFKELKYDIVLCTLTLHHFKEDLKLSK